MLAEAWLDAPSSIFWETAAIIVLTIVLIVIGILTLRTAVARKSLNCSVISRTRLLDAPKSMRGKLQVIFGNEPLLGDPYVTVVEIANTGKTSIASRLFDNDRSMIFDLGADVVEVLSVERTPESSPLPNIVSSGSSTIELQPELVAAGEVIKASVLTRDRVQGIELTLNPLSESYKISTRDREIWQRQQARRLSVVRSTIVVLLVLELAGLWVITDHALNNANTAVNNSMSLAKINACVGVDESSANLTSTATDDVDRVLVMFSGDTSHLITVNQTFGYDIAYLNLQIVDFGHDTAVAAELSINMKESSRTVQEASRLSAVLEEFPKSKTVLQQKADLKQAEALSLQVLTDVNSVIHECRPYIVVNI